MHLNCSFYLSPISIIFYVPVKTPYLYLTVLLFIKSLYHFCHKQASFRMTLVIGELPCNFSRHQTAEWILCNVLFQDYNIQSIERRLSKLSGERANEDSLELETKIKELTEENDRKIATHNLLTTQIKRLQVSMPLVYWNACNFEQVIKCSTRPY